MRTKIIVLIVAAAALGTAAYTYLGQSDEGVEVSTVTVESGPITMIVETLGTVEPLSKVRIGCETTGKIVEILVDHDDPVKKDQVICRIDPEIAEAQHQQSAAELERAQSAVAEAGIGLNQQKADLPWQTEQARGRLEEAKAALDEAEFNWKRIDKLFEDGQASEAEWNLSKGAYERAKAAVTIATAAFELAKSNEKYLPQRAQEALEQAQSAEKLAQARFDSTEAQVERCVIRSPIDGIVLRRHMDVGTTVNATFQAPLLFDISPDLSRVKVNAKVSESDIIHIAEGQSARFTVEGKRRSEFQGTILHKRNQPEFVQNVVTYTVILEVDNDADLTLLPGMSVNVEIECVHRPQALKISNAALRFKPPITLEQRRELIDAAVWPDLPSASDGKRREYCQKEHAWRFDRESRRWQAVPLWIGITDNMNTELLVGANVGDEFVRKFVVKESTGFDLKELMKQARPDQRTL